MNTILRIIRNLFTSALLLLAALVLHEPAYAQVPPPDNIWFVDDDSPGGFGASWENAFNNLQDALDAAEGTFNQSDLIKVAQGTYLPTFLTTGNPRSATFPLDFNQVTIEGGYKGCPDGNCENPDDRDIDL